MISLNGAPEILLAAALALASALTVVLVRRRRRKSPDELERLRRLDVNRHGRLATGQILDFVEPPPGKAGPRLMTRSEERRVGKEWRSWGAPREDTTKVREEGT